MKRRFWWREKLSHQLPGGKVVTVDLRKVSLYESKKSWFQENKVAEQFHCFFIFLFNNNDNEKKMINLRCDRGRARIQQIVSNRTWVRIGKQRWWVVSVYWRCTRSLYTAGFLVDYISHPVINSFTTAAAITIAASQLKASCTTLLRLLHAHALVVNMTLYTPAICLVGLIIAILF